MEIVLNKNWGGFDLCSKALEALYENENTRKYVYGKPGSIDLVWSKADSIEFRTSKELIEIVRKYESRNYGTSVRVVKIPDIDKKLLYIFNYDGVEVVSLLEE